MNERSPWRRERKQQSVCKPDCPRRSAECHATCEEYLEAWAKRKAELEATYRRRQEQKEMDDYFIKQAHIRVQRRGLRKKK